MQSRCLIAIYGLIYVMLEHASTLLGVIISPQVLLSYHRHSIIGKYLIYILNHKNEFFYERTQFVTCAYINVRHEYVNPHHIDLIKRKRKDS